MLLINEISAIKNAFAFAENSCKRKCVGEAEPDDQALHMLPKFADSIVGRSNHKEFLNERFFF